MFSMSREYLSNSINQQVLRDNSSRASGDGMKVTYILEWCGEKNEHKICFFVVEFSLNFYIKETYSKVLNPNKYCIF